MEPPPPLKSRFSYGCALASLVVVAVFVWLLIQARLVWSLHVQQLACLNGAHELHIAMRRMVTDTETTPDPKIGWPGDLPDIQSVGDYAERMVEYKYLERDGLNAYFYSSGAEPYAGSGVFKSENSAFKIYKVKKTDVDDVISIATRNFTFGKPLDPKAAPFGDKLAVIMLKGGSGEVLSREKASTAGSGAIGLMPGATSKAAPGTERDVLK